MIELIQHGVPTADLISNINKLDEFELDIDRNMVEHDIQRMKAELDKSRNRYDKTNIKNIIKYLEKMLDNMDENNKLEMCWNITKDNIPVTYPIKVINEELYKVDISNYINTSTNEYILNIDLKDLADIMAFEFIHKELGETHESIEELLDSCGIMSLEDSSILINKFKENDDKMYNLSRSLKISDSPYACMEEGVINDYFNTKQFKCKTYKEVIEYSCKYALTIITNNLLGKLNSNKISYRLITITPTSLVLLIDNTDSKEKVQEIIEDVAIRVFGRRFKINSNINIY